MWDKFDAALKSRGWTQRELEESLSLPRNRVSKWKARPENLPLAEAARIARTLGLSLDYLTDDDAADPGPASPRPELTYEEKTILATVAHFRLSLGDAMRRLEQPAPPASTPKARPKKHGRGGAA